MTDDRQRREASAGTYPWFRLFASEFAMQTISFKAIEKGVYITLLVMMHERVGPIPEDHSRIATSAGTTPAAARNALEVLIQARAVYRTSAGMLWSHAAERDLELREKTTKVQREKSLNGWKKRKENQSSGNAVAYKSQNIDTDIDSQTLKGSEKSYTSHTSDNDGDDAPARDSAGSHTYRADEPFTLPDVGDGYVSTIISRRPVIFTAVIYPTGTNDALNFIVKPTPSGEFKTQQISDQEATNLHYKHAEDDDDAA